MSKDGKDELQQELRLLKTSREPIHVSRQIVGGLLAQMRQPLAIGTLQPQRTVLESTLDRIVLEPHRAELY